MKTSAILVAFAFGMSACTSTRVGSLTLASTKNLGYTYAPVEERVSGEDCATNILGIPLGSINPNVQEAVDHAVSQTPNGDMMTNVSIHDDLIFTLLFNQACVKVQGDVVRSTNTIASAYPTTQLTSSSLGAKPAEPLNRNGAVTWTSHDPADDMPDR
ncbi:MAG: hypothetical protein ACLQBA_26105 [Candidatus Binataceae bacterium]|jgi:hypothetical protein